MRIVPTIIFCIMMLVYMNYSYKHNDYKTWLCSLIEQGLLLGLFIWNGL